MAAGVEELAAPPLAAAVFPPLEPPELEALVEFVPLSMVLLPVPEALVPVLPPEPLMMLVLRVVVRPPPEPSVAPPFPFWSSGDCAPPLPWS